MDIGIDLGTASVLVYVRGKGIALKEPSVVALDKDSGKMLAVGEEARKMIGRTPGNIVAIRPLREGVIADYTTTELMLKYFLNKVVPRRIFRPRIMICVPAVITTVEKRAVIEASTAAGARQTFLIEEPIAAAIGAGIDISKPFGSMVVDIGGGTTDIAVLSLGGIVCGESIRVAGDKFDEAIVRYVKKEFNLMIGERTAEEVKIGVANVFPEGDDSAAMDVRGRSLITGLPQNITITAEQTREALQEPVEQIVNAIFGVLEKTPPELSSDISERGIVMTGGGSLLRGLDRLISHKTGIPVTVAEDAVSCVALGAGRALENLDMLGPNAIYTK
ncbi:MAG: rod shape-determining protein MreB [Thermoanaerobacteraceae bacterium]|jgi:rod shape-determining protein MreB|uniref:Cell shape-determining protein MreB n=1 Tax=Biomaibacter acetigenes TaxID=2316383 RepID=A0A3G2R8L1_9FIRM|nr:rod shape-determining protein MreB [Biomaibacter acetigenes]AYO31776.1 MreB/Mrl family cell shape determining protein [Biomaibacter acetigenes]MDK2878687.1 rod shape-determining protein MreB [Thermoanaerobacteraceae bacterium]MDN5302276.1 rod shape-determining protein MreB [Thermoanaerobacteraceae bacterium]RKL62460.1 MreB/Mrl family cell shape determining protein [Thermoanaerobacteraceae bacterium SP2]